MHRSKGFKLVFSSYEKSGCYITIDGTKIYLKDLTEKHVVFILNRGMHGLSDFPFFIKVGKYI